MKKGNQRTIKFTKDFANKIEGDKMECDGMLASQLVHRDKVAKYVDVKEEPKKKKKSQK
jgi:hypothetical protein